MKKAKAEGEVTKFIPRTKAIRKLQLSISQFRRLCILKGIYPVEPKNKRKVNGNSTLLRTFYHVKDIQYLMHEPILETMRNEKIYNRKLGKAINKKQVTNVKQLLSDKPVFKLDHIIKERYPTFQDALRDLDDAISMLALFSTLPSDSTVPEFHIQESTRLYNEFLQYCIQANVLKKTFLSIKGIYYQVEIMGTLITWITPYQFSQTIPEDVDFKILKTFLEINETLVSFVNYKLYSDLELVYPPKLDQGLQESGAGLSALLIRKANEQVPVKGKQIKKRVKTLDLEAIQNDDEESEEEEEEVEKQDPKLFQKCVFWISREVPRYSLEFVITAMGGQCGWDATSGSGSPFTIDSEKITHVITDRPNVQMVQGKEYLQPQWVYDCVNQQGLVNTKGYHPGEQLPPHLSPFVVKDEEDYDPEKQLEEVEDVEEPIEQMDIDVEPTPAEPIVDKETKELKKIMMSKREKKLYEKIQFGKERKREAVKKLEKKKRSG